MKILFRMGRYATLLLMSLLLGNSLFAQENSSYLDETIEERSFDKKKWKAATKDLSFIEKKAEKKKVEAEEKDKSIGTMELSQTAKNILFVIGIGLIVLMLGFILYRLFVGEVRVSNPKIKRKAKEFTIEEVEENLQESDLEIFLRQALANKSYKLAIRIYYLMIIKELSSANSILWKKDKTNREYIREMKAHATFDNFRDLTRTFERVWYGDYKIEQDDFANMKPRFENYVQLIKQ